MLSLLIDIYICVLMVCAYFYPLLLEPPLRYTLQRIRRVGILSKVIQNHSAEAFFFLIHVHGKGYAAIYMPASGLLYAVDLAIAINAEGPTERHASQYYDSSKNSLSAGSLKGELSMTVTSSSYDATPPMTLPHTISFRVVSVAKLSR